MNNRDLVSSLKQSGNGPRDWSASRFAQALQMVLLLTAAALFVASLKLPLWHIRLEAPQYRGAEALHVAVYPGAMQGDLKELATLNQYIGVHIPSTLPQFHWLPGAIMIAGLVGVLTGLLAHCTRALVRFTVPAALAVALALAAFEANQQMREIGHHRDRKTPLVGVQDFTPPFLGHARIAQFEVTSALGWGAWLIGAGMGLQTSAAWLSRRRARRDAIASHSSAAETAASLKPASVLH